MSLESFPTTTEIARTDVDDVKLSNARLVRAIASKDYLTYKHLVDEDLTCFEPETCGHLVRGLAFHEYYFKLSKGVEKNVTFVEEDVKIMGDVALLSAVLLSQIDGVTTRTMETRLWRRTNKPDAVTSIGKWRLVHFHRSIPTNSYGH